MNYRLVELRGPQRFNDPDSRAVADRRTLLGSKRPIGEVKGQTPIKEKIKDGRAMPREPALGGKSVTLQDSRKQQLLTQIQPIPKIRHFRIDRWLLVIDGPVEPAGGHRPPGPRGPGGCLSFCLSNFTGCRLLGGFLVTVRRRGPGPADDLEGEGKT